MSSSPLKKAGAVTSGQLEQNVTPRSPGNPNYPGPVLDVDSSEVTRQYEPQRALPLPGKKIVISPTELIVESVGETSLVPSAVEMDSVLVHLDEAQRALAEAKSIQEVKQIADVAEAAKVFLKRAKASAQAVFDATALRVHAERRLGEMLIEAKKAGNLRTAKEGRPPKSLAGDEAFILAELDISYDQSARAQKLAALPEQEFEKRMLTCQDGGHLSISLILREIDVHRARKPQKPSSPPRTSKRIQQATDSKKDLAESRNAEEAKNPLKEEMLERVLPVLEVRRRRTLVKAIKLLRFAQVWELLPGFVRGMLETLAAEPANNSPLS